MTPMADLTRRALLRWGAGAGAGAAGVWAFGALVDPLEPQAAPAPFEPPTAGSSLPTRISGSFISAARGGIKTNWVISMPPGQSGQLRPVIALHGKDGNAGMMLDLGVEQGLARLVKEGKPAFAVVGVDGGNTYWHRRSSGGDSGAMVLDELLPMLTSMGMDTSRVGFLGWSMGGIRRAAPGCPVGSGQNRGDLCHQPGIVHVVHRQHTRGVRQLRRLCATQRVGPARAELNPATGGLRHQRPLLLRHSPIRQPTAPTACRQLLARRTRRVVLARTVARRTGLDGVLADVAQRGGG